jgi:hypothetical protein
MYAMTGKMTAQPGKRPDLVVILNRAAEMVGEMAGCRMYIVSEARPILNGAPEGAELRVTGGFGI